MSEIDEFYKVWDEAYDNANSDIMLDYLQKEIAQSNHQLLEKIYRDIQVNDHITAEEFKEHYLDSKEGLASKERER